MVVQMGALVAHYQRVAAEDARLGELRKQSVTSASYRNKRFSVSRVCVHAHVLHSHTQACTRSIPCIRQFSMHKMTQTHSHKHCKDVCQARGSVLCPSLGGRVHIQSCSVICRPDIAFNSARNEWGPKETLAPAPALVASSAPAAPVDEAVLTRALDLTKGVSCVG